MRCSPRSRTATPTACARCCPATSAAAPAISASSRRCSTRARPTRSRRAMKNTFIGTPMERREDLRFLRGRGEYVDDVAIAGPALCGDPAQLRGARPPRLDRRLGGARSAGRACGHHRRRHAGRPADHPDAAAAAAGVQAVRAAGDRPRQGALRRRADRGGAGATASPSARTRWRRSRSRSRICRRSPTGRRAAKNKSLLFEKPGTNRSLVFQSRKGDADAAFANAPYVRRERLRTGRHYGLTMEPRGVMADVGRGQGQAHGLRRRQGAVLQPPHPLGADRPAGRADRDDRERRRRRLRRARRVLSRGFPDPVRGAPRQPPGEMDRGPPRKPDGDEPRPRGGVRLEIACERDGTILGHARRGPHRHGRLHAHQRRGRRAQRRAVHGRAVSRAARQDRLARCG